MVNFYVLPVCIRKFSFFGSKIFVDNKKDQKNHLNDSSIFYTMEFTLATSKKKLPQLIVKYRAFNIIVWFDENLKDTKRDTLYTYMAYSRLERATSKNPSLYTWSSHTTGIPEPDFNFVGGGGGVLGCIIE